MATISTLGIGAGIDSESIITRLMSVESQPITAVQRKNSDLNAKLSTWGQIQSAFSALKDASASLAKPDLWKQTVAVSGDTSAVTVTAGAGAPSGNYSIQASQLAQSQYVASPTYADSEVTLGSGNLSIELGRYANDDPNASPPPPAVSFAARSDASAAGLSIAISATDTLTSIRDKINAANAGVTASVINDSSGARLVLRGATGRDNAFRVQVTQDAAPASGVPQLSDLAFDGSDGVTNVSTRTLEAVDARASINGVSVTSATNAFTNVLDGLSMTVSKVTDNAVNVDVKNDSEGMTKAVNAFVGAYNALVNVIRTQTSYDADTKTAAALQGDSSATSLLAQLRRMVASPIGGEPTFSVFSELGITSSVQGTLSVDATKLGKAMQNLPAVAAFFSNVDPTDSTRNGMGERFRLLAKQVTDLDGTITTRTTGIRSNIRRNEDRISDLQDRNTLVEARLRAQYQSLDQSMNRLSGLSAYVTQQLAALNKTG